MHVYQHINDQELINLLHQEDRCAFTEIHNRYENLLERHAYKKPGDLDETNDILQQLFVNLLDKRTELPVYYKFFGISLFRNAK